MEIENLCDDFNLCRYLIDQYLYLIDEYDFKNQELKLQKKQFDAIKNNSQLKSIYIKTFKKSTFGIRFRPSEEVFSTVQTAFRYQKIPHGDDESHLLDEVSRLISLSVKEITKDFEYSSEKLDLFVPN
jgi:hypothetical protein